MKILCAADLHLGRKATRLPAALGRESIGAVDGWRDIVQLALGERVGLVLLAGDVVDWENRYFEAYGPLEQGVRRLLQAGIPVWAVAGNHDVEALPRLADALRGSPFRLLGRGGRWERAVLEEDGRPRLAVDGWSFQARYEKSPPLATYSLGAPEGMARLVMLHGDLDQGSSSYAPVSSAEMVRVGADFWLLGHIHKPLSRELPGGGRVLYPGSPTALDPGETGPHGPWLVDLEGGRLGCPRQVALSRVRYETVKVDLTGMTLPEELDVKVPEELQRQAAALVQEQEAVRALSLRVALVGSTSLHGRLAAKAAQVESDLSLEVGGVAIGFDRVEVRTTPARELAELARGVSPVALLARLLLELEGDGGDRPELEERRAAPEAGVGEEREGRATTGSGLGELVELVARQFQSAAGHRPFQQPEIDWKGVDESQLRERLRRAGLELLEQLLAQGEER